MEQTEYGGVARNVRKTQLRLAGEAVASENQAVVDVAAVRNNRSRFRDNLDGLRGIEILRQESGRVT